MSGTSKWESRAEQLVRFLKNRKLRYVVVVMAFLTLTLMVFLQPKLGIAFGVDIIAIMAVALLFALANTTFPWEAHDRPSN